MNYDQNAKLRTDCSETDAFPARTQLRERTNEAFCAPLKRDLNNIKFIIDPRRLIPMGEIIGIVKGIKDALHAAQLKTKKRATRQ
ncbi:hypothetical protein IMF27_03460 [Pseudomonas sp. PCH199]|uniref:hypothetical protein n=1 Tax=unclassified Pseudomonas TaxID=196821 RepID=UPI000FFC8C70|nr:MULTISPECIES: hypothetical protein [unclassified Pseudomonas]MCW8274881.1 hypothetical protein [Pseudomonas sp. PCH199]